MPTYVQGTLQEHYRVYRLGWATKSFTSTHSSNSSKYPWQRSRSQPGHWENNSCLLFACLLLRLRPLVTSDLANSNVTASDFIGPFCESRSQTHFRPPFYSAGKGGWSGNEAATVFSIFCLFDLQQVGFLPSFDTSASSFSPMSHGTIKFIFDRLDSPASMQLYRRRCQQRERFWYQNRVSLYIL